MFKKIIIIIILITRCFHRLRIKKFSSPCSRYFFFFYFKIWKDNERKFIKFRYFNWKNLSRSQRRNLFNDKRKKKGEREAEKSVSDKILLKKPSKILSVAGKGRKRGDETNFNHKWKSGTAIGDVTETETTDRTR